MQKRFDEFMKPLKETLFTLGDYVDFSKVAANVDEISMRLNQLNYLIGQEDIDAAVRRLWSENPKTFSVLEILMFEPRDGKKYSNRGGNIHLFNANVIKYSVIPTKSRISMNFLIRNHSRLSCRFIYFSNRYPRPRIVRIYADGSSSSFARSLLIQTIILLSATI